jgi:hypothetical protein
MPLLVLGAILFGSVAFYVYISNNRERFAKIISKSEPKGPQNVIYLPADLEAYKKKGKSDDNEKKEN